MVSLFVVEEIVNEKDVAEVHEAIALASFFKTQLVHRHFKVIKPIFVVFFKIVSDFGLGISTWHIFYHEIGSVLFTV